MKSKRLNLVTIIVILLLVAHAIWKWVTQVWDIDSWIAPFLAVCIYFLFQLFISNPELLVKRSLYEIEHPGSRKDEIIQAWKIRYYYLRLILIVFIGLLDIFVR
ncbi:hypothetical protein [Chitinophaga tropicalis]|uniref:Uncharacterized protein n=1 Tax=Chitinophaga tropicalis TaxID=2683588 RepID=A0A7K1UCK8_9BACT|nr:hypothetical protein [Chitinophaga tropicalis]MVT12114.1 hypothetical protein [Chitinophaga tropicalis]